MTSLPARDLVFSNAEPESSLIELYSSEGCSSCPPAEDWLNHLSDSPDLWKTIFPVAFHVDYWDGLGWPDRFASAVYTQRQRDYAAQLGQDSVYTPEFVLNGLEWQRGWLGGNSVPSTAAKKSGVLTVTLHGDEKALSAIYVPGASAPTHPLILNVALLGFNVVTDVKAGENSGRTLQHDFVVLGFDSSPLTANDHGHFTGSLPQIKSSTTDTPGAVVAWVSENGTILQVAGGWLR